MSKGFVYILSNPHMPGLVKIGKTTRSVEGRAAELYQTGVPAPFKVEHEVMTPDCHHLELLLHERFDDRRVNVSREFFKAEVAEVERHMRLYLVGQLSDLVEEYDECLSLVEEPLALDEYEASELARELDVSIYDISGAISCMTPEELRPGLDRHLERMAKRRRARIIEVAAE